MTRSQYNTAVVGCGVIGRLHMRAITAHSRFALGALVDWIQLPDRGCGKRSVAGSSRPIPCSIS